MRSGVGRSPGFSRIEQATAIRESDDRCSERYEINASSGLSKAAVAPTPCDSVRSSVAAVSQRFVHLLAKARPTSSGQKSHGR